MSVVQVWLHSPLRPGEHDGLWTLAWHGWVENPDGSRAALADRLWYLLARDRASTRYPDDLRRPAPGDLVAVDGWLFRIERFGPATKLEGGPLVRAPRYATQDER